MILLQFGHTDGKFRASQPKIRIHNFKLAEIPISTRRILMIYWLPKMTQGVLDTSYGLEKFSNDIGMSEKRSNNLPEFA